MRSVVVAVCLLILAVGMYVGAKTFFNGSQTTVQSTGNTTITNAVSSST